MKSRIAIGCLGLIILLVAGGGYLFWRAKTPPRVGEDFKSLPREEQQRRRTEAQKLEDQTADIVRRVKSGDRKPFRLVATEQQLNTLLQDRIRTDKFALKDLRVGLKPKQLSLQGTVPYKGLETTATLTGDISAQNGRVKFNADKLLIGGLFEAPGDWKEKVEKQVDSQLNKLLSNAKVNITRAAVEEGQLILEGAAN